MSLTERKMPRLKPIDPDFADGDILAYNLKRLGYRDEVVRTTQVAELVTEKTGHTMSRQRIANLLNAIRISSATFEAIAKGIGVKPAELKRLPKR